MNVQFHYSHEVFLAMMSHVDEHDYWMTGGNVNESERADYERVHGSVPDNIHFGECPDPDVHVNRDEPLIGDRRDIIVTNNRGVGAHKRAFMVYTTERKLADDPPRHPGWMLIRKGIDPEAFAPSRIEPSARDGPAVTSVNNIRNRPRGAAVAVHDALLDASIDYRAYGHHNPDGHLERGDLADRLRSASVYANLSKTISPNALYEALMAGCPIVTVPGYGAQDAISHGYNGLIADTPERFVDAVEELLSNGDLADAFSRNARQTALGRYHTYEFVARWRTVLAQFQS